MPNTISIHGQHGNWTYRIHATHNALSLPIIEQGRYLTRRGAERAAMRMLRALDRLDREQA